MARSDGAKPPGLFKWLRRRAVQQPVTWEGQRRFGGALSTHASTVAVALVEVGVAFADRTFAFVPQNNSGLSGTAVLISRGNQTEIRIKITGAPADAIEPANIRIGDCVNAVFRVEYPLTNVVGGSSDTIIDAPLDDVATLSRVIILTESAANPSKFVACADIPFIASSPKSGGIPSGFVVLGALTVIGSGFLMRRSR